MLFSARFFVFLLLIIPATVLIFSNSPARGGSFAVSAEDPVVAEEDVVEGEEEEAAVEEETDVKTENLDEVTTEEEESVDEEVGVGPSSHAETQVLFVKPLDSANLPSGGSVRLLVGFANKGDKPFVVHSLDAAFRYPQDFSYYIQNFTESVVDKEVEPRREATFEYSFFVSENFNSRPFGLTVNVNYNDKEGKQFQNAVFNETVNITDPEEGFDGETFFLYVTLAALAVLLVIGIQQLLKSFGKKHLLMSKPRKYEVGTQSNGDIDMDYIPKENLQTASPRRTPRTSPRNRKNRKNQE